MMNKYTLVLFTVVLLIFFFYTPHGVTNAFIGHLIDLEETFQTQDGRLLRFRASHQAMDGNLFAETIRTGALEPVDAGAQTMYPSILLPPTEKHEVFSSFTMTCADVVHTYLLADRPLKIGVFVSTRKKLQDPKAPGNYLVLATYHVAPGMTEEEIRGRHHDTVRAAQDGRQTYMTMYDLTRLLSCSYVFNSHRTLSTIQQDDGTVLKKVNVTNLVRYNLSDLAAMRPWSPMKITFSYDTDTSAYTINVVEEMLL